MPRLAREKQLPPTPSEVRHVAFIELKSCTYLRRLDEQVEEV